jgi:hypothetical protein
VRHHLNFLMNREFFAGSNPAPRTIFQPQQSKVEKCRAEPRKLSGVGGLVRLRTSELRLGKPERPPAAKASWFDNGQAGYLSRRNNVKADGSASQSVIPNEIFLRLYLAKRK